MKTRRILLLAAGSLTVLTAGSIFYAAFRIERTAASAVAVDLNALPKKRVGLVLGCSPVLKSGAANWFFDNRIAAAAELFRSSKIEYLLVSGDNHTVTYDEPTAMKSALIQLGVPEDRIVLDHAGFSTLDSIVRAKKVFGLSDFCIITQKDHAMRAIYIARANGIEAAAYPAKDVTSINGFRTYVRESLARVRTLLDVHILGRSPRFLGPRIEIGKNT